MPAHRLKKLLAADALEKNVGGPLPDLAVMRKYMGRCTPNVAASRNTDMHTTAIMRFAYNFPQHVMMVGFSSLAECRRTR